MTHDELLRRVNVLRRTDNVTNWFYLAREYLFLSLVLGLTIAFYHWIFVQGLSWLYAIPVSGLAVVLIGAGQHRLTTLGHEASHYVLFRNRLLNELVSDWLCMFPVWSTTHYYRLQHLAHHQFPNDPVRDPDVLQMEGSGHRFHFPMSPRRFIWQCVVKQLLWPPSLIRYICMRAHYATTGGGSGPYSSDKNPRTRVLIAVGAAYIFALTVVLAASIIWHGSWQLLVVVPAGLWMIVTAFYALIPHRFYRSPRLKPDVSNRWNSIGRLTYTTLLFTGLACLHRLTGEQWGMYYLVLWGLPLVTSFAYYMIARQIVQHGHGGQSRFGNTRVFLVGWLFRWAVFPLGMEYHLPHHLFPLVPHYRLPQLHALLLEHSSDYREHCTIVEGYFFHRRPPEHATVLEVMARPG